MARQDCQKTKNISSYRPYLNTLIFGLAVFAATYAYISYQGIPGVLNKAVADTAILLMGFSLLLSSLCYYWDLFDTKIVYRKHLGLIGYVFAIVHILLSWGAFMRLFDVQAWSQGKIYPALAGALAIIIFSIMALISNQYAARELGGRLWRQVFVPVTLALSLLPST